MTAPLDPSLEGCLRRRLEHLYGDRAEQCLTKLLAMIEQTAPKLASRRKTAWDQRDVVLITYGDQVQSPGASPLACLREFLVSRRLDALLSTVHVLPFFPYSSDDGFSVIDYRTVDPALGDWSDVGALGGDFDLMFDLVINHCSRQSRWFDEYAKGNPTYASYFIEVDPAADVSMVTRPRKHPLLSPTDTSRGTRHLWTTFSDDQIDLNFAEPDVLLEMIDILLFYLRQGARIIRLDAIAYLWKELGTPCIHLPETHTVVKLMRDVTDALAPGTILLTETNVPHEENASYFGRGDEAQMVYQFSLAPLLLEALLSGNTDLLVDWLTRMEPTPPGTTVLNFTASHDGIGVRPLEGLMRPDRFDRLIAMVKERGGRVSMKRNADGSQSPYELNITYFDAVAELNDAGPDDPDPAIQVRRFLAGQALMLSLQGIPAVYFHSLIGTPNDTAGVERTGRARSINRRKFELSELTSLVEDHDRPSAAVFEGYCRLLRIRGAQPAFHPDADQEVIPVDHRSTVGLLRTSIDREQRILVLCNFGREAVSIDVAGLTGRVPRKDLLGPDDAPQAIGRLEPYQVAWLLLG
ncbi:MAG: alpha-amylase family glycosyl hydrolase [Thermoguttaceae bacterium]